MLANSPLINDASGRLGNDVWARNRYGLFVRSIGNPNPSGPTDEQLAARQAMADCVTSWRSVLSSEQRSAWTQAAIDNPEPSRLGTLRPIDGLAAFTRANFGRRQAYRLLGGVDLPCVLTAPPVLLRPWLTADQLDAVITGYDPTIHLSWDEADTWAFEDNGGAAVYISPALPLSLNFYKSPMTLGLWIAGREDGTDTFNTLSPPNDTHYKVKVAPYFGDGSIHPPFTIDVLTAHGVPLVPGPTAASFSIGTGLLTITWNTLVQYDDITAADLTGTDASDGVFSTNVQGSQGVTATTIMDCAQTDMVAGSGLVSYLATLGQIINQATGLPIAAFADFPCDIVA